MESLMNVLQEPALWIGLALSIPGSVAANFFTPWLRRRMARRSEAKAAKRTEQLRAELDELAELAADPARHQIFLLESILDITMLTALMGVVAGMAYMFAQFTSTQALFLLVGRMVAVLGGAVVMKECAQAVIKSRRVRRIEEYRKKVADEMQALESRIA